LLLALRKEAFKSYPSRFKVKEVPLKIKEEITKKMILGRKYFLTTILEVNLGSVGHLKKPYNPHLLQRQILPKPSPWAELGNRITRRP